MEGDHFVPAQTNDNITYTLSFTSSGPTAAAAAAAGCALAFVTDRLAGPGYSRQGQPRGTLRSFRRDVGQVKMSTGRLTTMTRGRRARIEKVR